MPIPVDVSSLQETYPDFSDEDILDLAEKMADQPSEQSQPNYTPEVPSVHDEELSDGITNDSFDPTLQLLKHGGNGGSSGSPSQNQSTTLNVSTPNATQNPLQSIPSAPINPLQGNTPQGKASLIDTNQPNAPLNIPESSNPVADNPNYRQIVLDDIIKKYGLDKYSPQAREQLVQQTEQASSPPNWAAAFSALGTGLQGGNAAESGLNMLKYQNQQRQFPLQQFDIGRGNAYQNAAFGEGIQDKAQANALAKAKDQRENDPNSPDSKIGQALLVKMGVDPKNASKVSAAQFKNYSPAFAKMYQIAEDNAAREKIANARNQTTTSNANADIASRERIANARNTSSENVAKMNKENKASLGTPGQQAVDRGYQKDYNDYISTGRVQASASIDKLKQLKTELEKDAGTNRGGGGWWASTMPDAANTALTVRRRDDARNFANQSLKKLFGGQISDADRESAAKEFYNERDNNAGNAARLGQKIKELEDMRDAQDAKATYFKNHGSLSGFGENLPSNNTNVNVNQDLEDIKDRASKGDSEAKDYLDSIGE